MPERKGTQRPHEFRVVRRLHEQGGSLLVAVPKLWADAEGLQHRSTVEISFDGILTIRAVKAKEVSQ